MRGKKPKEREKYVIRMGDGALVEVNREIYLAWYQSKRQERYQKERDQKYGICSIERLYEKGYSPEQSACTEDETLEAALRNECRYKLESAIKSLPEQDAWLVKLLYFEDITVKEAAQIFDCSRKTIWSRRQRILNDLKQRIGDI